MHICTQTHAANTKKTSAIQQPELQYAAHNLNRHIIYQFYYYTIEIFLRILSNISTDVKKDCVYIQELESFNLGFKKWHPISTIILSWLNSHVSCTNRLIHSNRTYIYIYIYMVCLKSKCTDFPMYELAAKHLVDVYWRVGSDLGYMFILISTGLVGSVVRYCCLCAVVF